MKDHNPFEYTSMGGQETAFQTTCWTQLHDARTSDQERRRLIVDSLLQRYWKPVYCYLRRKGDSDAQAKDRTQDFFTDIVLQRELYLQADPQKGKFRSLLLTALKHYVTDKYRLQSTGKRHPNQTFKALHETDMSYLPVTSMGANPDACFNHAWIADLLECVVLEVKQECRRMKLHRHWEVFETRVLKPIIQQSQAPSLTELCLQSGIANEVQASNMIITVKRRLKKALERNLHQRGEEGGPEMAEQASELLALLRT